jgi:hypothetical protein
VQWPTASGGNGHYYDWIPGYIRWTDAKTAAMSLSFSGAQGHLATIATSAENDFFKSKFSQTGSGQTLIGWLGGFQDTTAPDFSEPAGGWRWVTGEPWTFTSWWTAQGFPDEFLNHSQNFVRTQPVGPDVFWDDIENDPGPGLIGGYFVEYPVPEPAGFAIMTIFTIATAARRLRCRPPP